MDAHDEYAYGPYDDARDNRILELEAEVEREMAARRSAEESKRILYAEVERLRRLIGDLRAETSDPIADDGRLGYVTVQMTRETYDELMASGLHVKVQGKLGCRGYCSPTCDCSESPRYAAGRGEEE
jgi:hypothetical protein